jgi:hypothetical protein
MRILGGIGLVAIALVTSARGDTQLALTQPVINALTPIDSVPSTDQINDAFNGSSTEALASLQDIANPAGSVDRGVQIRAVHALINYCASTPCAPSDPVHVSLQAIEARYHDARAGSDLLVLRAAIESLGALRVPQDVYPDSPLIQDLNHPSRDIRTATARALRDLGNTNAIPFLRARYNTENEACTTPSPLCRKGEMVRLAISDALRVLGQPVP